MIRLIKQPGEKLRQPMTFGGVATIAALVGVTVAARGLMPGAPPLVAAPHLFANALSLDLSGGGDGELYLVTATVDDAAGDRREEEIEVAVVDQAWTMPDGGAPMLTIAQFVSRFGLEETVRMTDADGTGRIGRAQLVNALIDAQAIAEAHIASRVTLPIDPVPTMLQLVIADLARERLYQGTVPDGIERAARTAMRALERMQSGQIPIPGAPPVSTGASDTPVLFHSGGRAYPDGLDGY